MIRVIGSIWMRDENLILTERDENLIWIVRDLIDLISVTMTDEDLIWMTIREVD